MTKREPPDSEWLGQLSEADTTGGAPHAEIAIEGGRYRIGGELGAGSMGRVRAAFDVLLERTVAIKQVLSDGDVRAEAALLREARITAGLDHPGIIAVLDAGVASEGGRFYAMRIVHGRSLAELVTERPRPSAAERATWLRAMLSAAQAIGYAHARGVVHRDLSPRNIRLGAHGEVVVLDWGLAASIDEAARGGVVCGTPGFRAGELARAEPAGPPSDVWSLGALIHFVCAGEAPRRGAPARALPAELRSLLGQALASDPARRYADAGALAADLAAFLDGARVTAHRDRPWDRIVRFGRRRPAVVAAAGLGVAAVAGVALVLGTLATRRATEARRSREEARAALRDMLVERAATAVRADDRAEAERIADRLDALGGSDAARGVRAAFAMSPRITMRVVADEAACRTLAVRDDGMRLCVLDGGLVADGPGRSLAPLGLEAPSAARFLRDGGALVVRSTDRGNEVVRYDRELHPFATEHIGGGDPQLGESGGWAIIGATDSYLAVSPTGERVERTPCPPGTPLRVVAAHPGATEARPAAVVFCSDGHLVLDLPSGAVRMAVPALVAELPAASRGVVIDDDLVLASSDGRIGVVDLTSGRVRYSGPSPLGPARRMDVIRDHEILVVGEEGVGWFRADVGAWRVIVPARDAIDGEASGAGAFVFGAGTLRRLDRGAGVGVHRIAGAAGLASIAWSRDGRVLALGAGEGSIALYDATADTIRRLHVAEQVIKAMTFDLAGRALFLGVATGDGVRVLDLGSERVQTFPDADRLRVRRIELLADDIVLPLRYGRQQFAYRLGSGAPAFVAPLASVPVDATAPTRPGAIYVVGTDGAPLRYGADGHVRALRRAAQPATAIAVSADGQVLALIRADDVVELRDADTEASRETLAVPGAAIEDAALDPRGAHLALGRADGTVELWDLVRGTREWSVRAHALRVGALAFSPDGCALATASWDETARVFETCTAASTPR
jgi:hypothetical protein